MGRLQNHEGCRVGDGVGECSMARKVCGDQACGPTTFANAKAAAISMRAADACGDYTVERPIAHLNGLQALIEDAALRKVGPPAREYNRGPLDVAAAWEEVHAHPSYPIPPVIG